MCAFAVKLFNFKTHDSTVRSCWSAGNLPTELTVLLFYWAKWKNEYIQSECYINEDTYQSHCLVNLYIFTLLPSLAVNFDSIPVNAKSKMLRTYSHSRMCRHAFKCPFQISIETDRLHSWISERVGSWKFEVLKVLKVLQFYRYCTSKS